MLHIAESDLFGPVRKIGRSSACKKFYANSAVKFVFWDVRSGQVFT